MGLLDGQNISTFYASSGRAPHQNQYQFVTLDHIVSSFMVMNVGEGKIISKVKKTEVQFHAMRAIQEFSYDIFRSVKSQEIEVPNTLKMLIPHDYVNYIKVTRSGSDGIERNLYPTGKTSNPFAISQDANGAYEFVDLGDGAGDVPKEQDLALKNSDTWTNFKSHTSEYLDASRDDYETDDEIIHQFGRRYGLDPQHAHQNGTFYISERTGHIHFGSNLSGVTVILHYISDGLGRDDEMIVHKFAEEAIYKWIAYGVISSRSNMPEYIVQRFKRERFAEARKAKIRLSSIKIEEFTQVLKGLSKPIK